MTASHGASSVCLPPTGSAKSKSFKSCWRIFQALLASTVPRSHLLRPLRSRSAIVALLSNVKSVTCCGLDKPGIHTNRSSPERHLGSHRYYCPLLDISSQARLNRVVFRDDSSSTQLVAFWAPPSNAIRCIPPPRARLGSKPRPTY